MVRSDAGARRLGPAQTTQRDLANPSELDVARLEPRQQRLAEDQRIVEPVDAHCGLVPHQQPRRLRPQIGEYLARMHFRVMERPPYVVAAATADER